MFISTCNHLAYNFVEKYDITKSPVISVIYGPCGVGKTVLLAYLHEKIKKESKQVLLIEAGKFSAKYAFAAQSGYLSAFRKDIRSYKLILVDNIDVLKGKKKSIEELFHTLETITTQGGKAVITYQGITPSFDYLGERFASRLRASLAISMTEPSLAEKESFIDYYLNTKPMQDVLKEHALTADGFNNAVLAQEIQKSQNFSELIDKLHKLLPIPNRILSMEEDTGDTFQGVNELCQLPANYKHRLDIKEFSAILLPMVCDFFCVAESLVRGGAKRKSAVESRYMIYLLLNELCGYSYTEIAKAYGKNTRILVNNCIVLKSTRQEGFETLCQKLYNQLKTCKNSKEI